MHWRTAVCLVLILAAATACGRKAPRQKMSEKLAEKALELALSKQAGGDAKVDVSGDTISIKTGTGEEIVTAGGGAVKIPDDFPKDISVYKGATPVASMKMGKGYMLTLGTKDAVEAVIAAYKADMPAQGWKEEAAMDMGGTSSLSYTKAERHANVVVSAADGQTQIMLSVAAPEG